MNWLLRTLVVVLLPLTLQCCTGDSNYTITTAFDSRILVSQDKETMERMIECAITRECRPWYVMELLPSRKAFFVESGTRVTASGGLFAFSDAVKVHILDGEHGGENAWVYNRMLYQDESSAPYRLAFTGICQRDGK